MGTAGRIRPSQPLQVFRQAARFRSGTGEQERILVTFNTIDVETASSDYASICQIGIVFVRNGRIQDQWESLVNPECRFSSRNTRIHGIDDRQVRNSPVLPVLHRELENRLRGSVLVSHTSFDRTALNRAWQRYGLEPIAVRWLDSARIARHTWPDRYARRGYGLGQIAADLNISFRHHDALEDARAASEIVRRACAASKRGIEDWLRLL